MLKLGGHSRIACGELGQNLENHIRGSTRRSGIDVNICIGLNVSVHAFGFGARSDPISLLEGVAHRHTPGSVARW